MNEIEIDFHDHESSFDLDKETDDLLQDHASNDADAENELEKELVFYRRLDDY